MVPLDALPTAYVRKKTIDPWRFRSVDGHQKRTVERDRRELRMPSRYKMILSRLHVPVLFMMGWGSINNDTPSGTTVVAAAEAAAAKLEDFTGIIDGLPSGFVFGTASAAYQASHAVVF